MSRAGSPARPGPGLALWFALTLALVPGTHADPLRRSFERLPGGPQARSDLRLLPDNVEAWAARWRLVSAARTRIDFHTFIFEPDVLGLALLGRLSERAAEGLAVRFMVEASAAPRLRTPGGRALLRALAQHPTAEVRLYKPLFRGALQALAERDRFLWIAGNHDKLLLVDGELGLTGGRNQAAAYLVDPRDHPLAYRDTDVVVRGGRAVDDLRAAYDREWQARSNKPVEPRRIFPEIRPRDPLLATMAAAMDLYLASDPLSEEECRVLAHPEDGARARRAEARRLLLAIAAEKGSGPTDDGREPGATGDPDTRDAADRLGLDARDRETALARLEELAGYPRLRGAGRIDPLASGWSLDLETRVMDQTSRAGDGHDDLRPNLLRMLLAARSEAVIQTPCVSLTPLALEVLSRMGRNGVRIPMLTNGIETDENAVIQAFFLRFWPEYLARIPGLTFDVLTGTRMLHSKVAVLDRVLTLIGSYNLDPVSEVFNGEVGIAVWSPEFAAGNLALDASDRHPGPDPRNPLVRRYDVVRDSAGLARRHPEGHPRAGEVEVAFGPEHHTAKATLARIVKAGSRIFELFLPRLARFSR